MTREEYEAAIIALFEYTSLKELDLIYKIMLKSIGTQCIPIEEKALV